MAPRTDPNVRKYRIRLLPWVVTPWHLINENDKTLTLKDASMAKRMCDDDAPFILSCGMLSADAAKEILDIGREALRIKEPIAMEKIFDFSLAAEAAR